jgi:FtsH-binding integral membrane protein
MERECGQQLSVQVDVCSLCSGIYLDDGELPKIKRFSDSLQAVFTPNRQASLQRKARRREALSAIYGTESPAAKESVSGRLLFIQNVYLLLAVTLAMTAVGSLFGIQSGLALTLFWPALIFEIVVFLLLLGARRVPTLNLVLLFVYTFLSGFSLAAVLATYLAAGHAVIIWQAAGLTAATLVGLSIYIHVAKQNFTWMGGMLFISLACLILSGIYILIFGAPAL